MKTVSFAEAVKYAFERKIVQETGSIILFNDGTSIESESTWSGPYSEVTPDIEGEPPEFHIRDAEETKNNWPHWKVPA